MQRERPLQNSMFLPETNPGSTRRPSIPLEYSFPIPNVKKGPDVYSNSDSQFHSAQHRVIAQQTRQPVYNLNNQEDSNLSVRSGELGIHDVY